MDPLWDPRYRIFCPAQPHQWRDIFMAHQLIWRKLYPSRAFDMSWNTILFELHSIWRAISEPKVYELCSSRHFGFFDPLHPRAHYISNSSSYAVFANGNSTASKYYDNQCKL